MVLQKSTRLPILYCSSELYLFLFIIQVLNSWEEHGLNGPRLEVVLTSYLSSFSYPLSLILMR